MREKTKKRRKAERRSVRIGIGRTWRNEDFLGTGKEAPNWTWSFIAKISENLGGKGVEIKLYN
jgi:hypothetical protein